MSAAEAGQLHDTGSGNPDPRAGARAGVYWIREDREILSADWDQLLAKPHARYSHLNGFYVEIFLSNDFDPFLGLQTTKNGINLLENDDSERFRRHAHDTVKRYIEDAKNINSKANKTVTPPPASEVVQKENEHFCKKDMAKVERDLEGVPAKKTTKTEPGSSKGRQKAKNTGKKTGPRTKWEWILVTVNDIDDKYMVEPRVNDEKTIRVELNSRNQLVKYFNTCQDPESRHIMRGIFISQACAIMKVYENGDEDDRAAINKYRRDITYNNNVFMEEMNTP